MPVIASLKKPGGHETEWIDVGGTVTIDTIPPPKVEGLKARGFQDRVDISWVSLRNAPDLKGYVILRSEQPLSGYSRIGDTEQVVFEDKTVEMDKMYYYRVIAVDQTGNESEPQEAVRASLVGKEPVLLEGEIKKDTILSGLYIVEDEFIVPRGLVLTIEPGTRIIFDESASVNVNGKLIVNGKENPVEFLPSGDEQWSGVNIANGNVSVAGLRIKGAETGLVLKDTEGTVDGAFISENIKGIYITGSPSPVIKNSSISRNETGIELIRSDAAIIRNDVFQNKTGIFVKDFSGQIKDNNLIDNNGNASSEAPLKLAANFFGSVHVEEMRLKNINVVKVYDQRLPEGKIVDAIVNPYARMTHEERQKKLTELAIEAGNYFRHRNYGKASNLFEESLKVSPSADAYYYLALCYQEMKDDENATKILREGAEKFPRDTTLVKSLGLKLYQKGNEDEAKKVFEELIKLSPDDRQAKFLIERMKRATNNKEK